MAMIGVLVGSSPASSSCHPGTPGRGVRSSDGGVVSSFDVHQAIGDVLAFAVVVAVSPINIMAAILLLFSARPIAGAAAYLAGFAAGVAVALVALELVAAHLDLSNGSGPSRGAAVLRIVLGVAPVAAAVRKVRQRRGATGDGELPGWMNGISGFAPPKAAATGLAVGALNPKNLAMAVAASLVIGAASLTAGRRRRSWSCTWWWPRSASPPRWR